MSWWNWLLSKLGGGERRPAAEGGRAKSGCKHGEIKLRQGSAEFEHFIAKAELETTGNVRHGAAHLSNLLSLDPGRAEWIDLLDRYLASARADPESLIPREQKLYYSTEAMRAYIWQRQGRLEEAIDLLVQTTNAKPDAFYLDHWALGWLEPEGAIEQLSEGLTHRLFSTVLSRFGEDRYNTAARRRLLRRWCALNGRLPESQWSAGAPAMLRIGLMRKAGWFAEAEATASLSLNRQPNWHSACALGLALREWGKTDEAEVAFLQALQLDPADVSVRLEAGDMYYRLHDWQTALRWYESALAKEPQHPWARPSAIFCEWKIKGEQAPPNDLIELAKSGNQRAQQVLHEEFWNKLPEPVDATANLLREHRDKLGNVRGDEFGGAMKITLNCLEAPSNYLAFRMELRKIGSDMELAVTVESVQQPDPRLPIQSVKYPLWKYVGTDASPALPEPAADVAGAVAELASAPFDDPQNWATASYVAEKLGPQRVGEILAVMVHPPNVPESTTALNWLPRVQHAAAQVAAQVDCGWEDSARREALFSILHGPQDWATVAAIRALARIGRDEPALAVSIHDAFQLLADRQPNRGYCCWAYPLYQSWLELPHLFPGEREELKLRLKAMESTTPD